MTGGWALLGDCYIDIDRIVAFQGRGGRVQVNLFGGGTIFVEMSDKTSDSSLDQFCAALKEHTDRLDAEGRRS